ncbi:MAG: hypothetical protein IPH98_19715 [Saprospiraceae bacterium]|nr:hypothetical protein [Candidatus Defluviibacterium haderslevense]
MEILKQVIFRLTEIFKKGGGLEMVEKYSIKSTKDVYMILSVVCWAKQIEMAVLKLKTVSKSYCDHPLFPNSCLLWHCEYENKKLSVTRYFKGQRQCQSLD